MKRLLIVTDAWHPQVNGVVRVIEAQTPHLERQGYRVVLIDPSQFRSIPLPFYPEIRFSLFPRRKLERLIEEHNPDAIHVVTEGPLGVGARRYCIRRGLPFTTWYHTHFQLYIDIRIPGLLSLITWYLRRFHSKASRTMVSTPSLKESLERMGFVRVVVVPLGVDARLFSKSSALPPLPKPVFMYFGRLAVEKNPEEFLKLELPGTKLVIGDGPLRQSLEARYKDAMFVGYKQGQGLVDWISRADVFVFPSRTETFGLVQLEALACGVPVAAHDVMGPRDLITQGKDGYLGYDLAEAAKKCLSLNPADCRAKALEFTWERSAEGLIEQLAFVQK